MNIWIIDRDLICNPINLAHFEYLIAKLFISLSIIIDNKNISSDDALIQPLFFNCIYSSIY